MEKKLHFTSKLQLAVSDRDVCFIAVNTPSHIDGNADLSAFDEVVKGLAVRWVDDGDRVAASRCHPAVVDEMLFHKA